MRALIYAGRRQLEWREAPDPRVAGGQHALLRPVAATTCDLDRFIIGGKTPFEPPFAIGHEAVAEVVDVGDQVKTVRPGDLVIVPWHISCGECRRCRAGLPASCETAPRDACFGIPIGGHHGGLFSDLVLAPFADGMLIPLPAGVDPVAAAGISDNVTDAWIGVTHGLRKHPGEAVLIYGGTGSLGCYAVDLALAAGARSVDYVDPDPSRRAVAASLGASVHEAFSRDFVRQFAVVIVATLKPDEFRDAICAAAPGAHIHSVSIFFTDAPMPLWEMYMRDVTFSTGRPSVTRERAGEVVQLLACGHIHPERVVSRVADWDDAPQALLEGGLKPVIFRQPLRA